VAKIACETLKKQQPFRGKRLRRRLHCAIPATALFDGQPFVSIERMTIQVGSVVRAPRMTNNRPKTKVIMGRALVATVQEDVGTACLLWEPMSPQPPNVLNRGLNQTSKKFLVTPIITENTSDQDETAETTVPLQTVMELLPFEVQQQQIYDEDSSNTASTISLWKDCGDQLLRLGDASAAVFYYEMALIKSSILQIGSTIILQVQGFPKLAEVDCIEHGDYSSSPATLDIEIVETGTEMTISASQVLLCLWQHDLDKLQERILLNLARCLSQLAEMGAPAHRSRYLKAVVLSCTLALTVAMYRCNNSKEDTTLAGGSNDTSGEKHLPPNGQAALQLRARAYGNLSKWSHAVADAKRLISCQESGKDNGGNSVGRKLLVDLQRQQLQQVKTDKKLAKAVCQWVETATTTTQSEDAVSNETNEVNRGNFQEGHEPSEEVTSHTHRNLLDALMFWLPLISLAITAFLIQK
jgi:hypothetical protein